MLQSLEVRNYRNLRHLTIEKLGRVNLLVGKNNTGKTSVLEAVGIYVNEGNLDFLLRLSGDKGENYTEDKGIFARDVSSNFDESSLLKTFSALFTDRIPQFNSKNTLFIGESDIHSLNGRQGVSFRLIKYIEEIKDSKIFQSKIPRYILDEKEERPDAILGVEIKKNEFKFILS